MSENRRLTDTLPVGFFVMLFLHRSATVNIFYGGIIMEYASKATGGTALGLGIAGTAGWLLNGGLGNLFGGMGNNAAAAAVPAVAGLAAGMAAQKCGDDAPVSRYELDQAQTIANKDMEIAYWRGQDETNRKITDAYAKLESRIIGLAGEVRANKEEQSAINLQQAVYNGTNTATIGCIQNQVNQLLGLTKLVVPNGSVCPGWGAVTVKPETAAAAT